MTKKLKKALLDYYNGANWDEPKETEAEQIQMVQEFLKEEWGEGGDKGYAIFDEDYSFDFPVLVIERIDELGAYESDIEAAKQAKKDGIKLIPCKDYPYRTYPFNCYRFIDTVENREALQKNVKKIKYKEG